MEPMTTKEVVKYSDEELSFHLLACCNVGTNRMANGVKVTQDMWADILAKDNVCAGFVGTFMVGLISYDPSAFRTALGVYIRKSFSWRYSTAKMNMKIRAYTQELERKLSV